jgi:hypothetical protein
MVVEAWPHETMGTGIGAAVEAFHTMADAVDYVDVVARIGGLHYCMPVVVVVAALAFALALAWIHWHTVAFVVVVVVVFELVVGEEEAVPACLRHVILVAWVSDEGHVAVAVAVAVVDIHGD